MRKFIPAILIIANLAGTILPVNLAQAQGTTTDPNATGTCVTTYTPLGGGGSYNQKTTLGNCPIIRPSDGNPAIASQNWTPDSGGSTVVTPTGGTTTDPNATNPNAVAGAGGGEKKESDFLDRLGTCNPLKVMILIGIGACLVRVMYFLFVFIPSFILSVAAHFFDYMSFMTLQSDKYGLSFINDIWKVVRDLANIFFILILLYAAMQLILGIGHDSRKMVVWVIMMAILINFSLFFTRVVIDTSNIVGLVFYNRIKSDNVRHEPITSDIEGNQKDLAGALASKFNVNRFFTADTMDTLVPKGESLDAFTAMGIMTMYAMVIGVLAYAFFMAGLTFLSRMITLIILMIISPFAFMSYALPALRSQEFLGFKSWSQKLFSSAFAAAIFMFIIYVIAKILEADIFGNIDKNQGMVATLLGIFIPGILIAMLLLQGLKYTKKAAGDFSDKIIGGGKALAGFGLGVATGGAAFALQGTVGKYASNVASNDELRRKAAGGEGITAAEQKSAQRKLAIANSVSRKDFDIRQYGLAKFATKKAGLNIDAAPLGVIGLDTKSLHGGAHEQQENAEKKAKEKAASYEMSAEAAMRQDQRRARYFADKAEAQKFQKFQGSDEEEFRKAYEAGNMETLRTFGVTRNSVGKGVIESSSEINKARRNAYAISLEEKNKKMEGRNAMRAFYDGAKSSVLSKSGIGITATASVLAGPIGTAIAIGGAGFLGGLREAFRQGAAQLISHDASPLMTSLKETLQPQAANPEIIAAVRKGKTSDEKLADIIKKATKGDGHAAEEGVREIKKRENSESSGEKPEGGDTHH